MTSPSPSLVLRRWAALPLVAVAVGLTACSPSVVSSPSTSSTAAGQSSSSSASVETSSVEPSPSESASSSESGSDGGIAEFLATLSMPPKNFDSAPTFPDHLPDQAGKWTASGAIHNSFGTTGNYTGGTVYITTNWSPGDFGRYKDVTETLLADPEYYGDWMVCGHQAADATFSTCVGAMANGEFDIAGMLEPEELAAIADELIGLIAVA